MTSSDLQTLVFVGPMGAGKTSIGKRVARELGLPFTDTDAMIVRAHGPIPALFVEHGEPHFRALERQAVTEALSHGGVIALGGGAVLDVRTRADLAAHRVVLLTVAPGSIRSRIGGTNRPLIAAEDPVARWTEIYDERRPLYEEVADVVFDSSTGHVGAIVSDIAAWARRDSAGIPVSEGTP